MRVLVHSSHFVLPHEFVWCWAEPQGQAQRFLASQSPSG